MTVKNILDTKKVSVSFEIFPPKKETAVESVMNTAVELCSLKPDFISITYGAGGSTRSNTVGIASRLQRDTGIPVLSHVTSVGSDNKYIDSLLSSLEENDIFNILALRGDMPKDTNPAGISACESDSASGINHAPDFPHASDLASYIASKGKFCIGGACYPEGHPESKNRDADLDNLKYKIDAGCSFLTTQMFFDNDMLYNFLYRMQSRGISVPVIAGIMPVTNASQISRMISLSNAHMPRKLLSIIDTYKDSPEALMQAGIMYAVDQIIDLITNGIRGIHIYTMNNSAVASRIMQNIDHIRSAVNTPSDSAR